MAGRIGSAAEVADAYLPPERRAIMFDTIDTKHRTLPLAEVVNLSIRWNFANRSFVKCVRIRVPKGPQGAGKSVKRFFA